MQRNSSSETTVLKLRSSYIETKNIALNYYNIQNPFINIILIIALLCF